MKIQIKKHCLQRISKGDCLITKEDIVSPITYQDGNIVEVYSGSLFVGKMIVGLQNKGIGYIFTDTKDEKFDAAFFYKLFSKAKQYRVKIRESINSTAYRLFNNEGDGLGGITIDLYNTVAVFSWYNVGIYQYASEIIQQFLKVNLNITAVYEKIRFKSNDINFESRFVCGQQEDYVEIIENNVKYATYMNEGMMTGIFLDQREVRNYLQKQTKNKTVLNTFSYTGAFSVASFYGGAKETISVDVAKRSVEKTKEHFKLNNLKLEHQKIYVMDVFDYFKYAINKKYTFDWVILDPPSFARTKKRTFSVLKNYVELLKDAIAITANNGRIVISTNASNFKKQDFEKMIHQTMKQMNINYHIERYFGLPKDFRSLKKVEYTNYLKVYVVQINRK